MSDTEKTPKAEPKYGEPGFVDRRAASREPQNIRDEHKFDPVTALDMRSGPRDRRAGDRRGADRRKGPHERRGGGYSAIRVRGISKRAKLSLVLAGALVMSLGVTYAVNSWFESQIAAYKLSMVKKAVAAPKMATRKVLVAARKLTYGSLVDTGVLKQIDWPADNVPAGAFAKAGDVVSTKGKRVALSTIEVNEPILPAKISKPGELASLSAMLNDGKKAVTVRVNDVFGVAGLILPNDKVDVMWTVAKRDRSGKEEPYTELLLREVRVLAIDQRISNDKDKPSVAKAVTLEVDLSQAQRIALGSETGTLQLALRSHDKVSKEPVSRVSMGQLGANSFNGPNARITVGRGLERQTYDVLKDTKPR